MTAAHSSPESEQQLAAFQAALLDILNRFSDPVDIHRELDALALPDDYQKWVRSFDWKMTEVAALLTQKWSVRARE